MNQQKETYHKAVKKTQLFPDGEYTKTEDTIMLAAKNMLKTMLEDPTNEPGKNHNDDHDFSKVLKFCGGNTVHNNKIRFSDGQEKTFSFDSSGKEKNEPL